MEKIIVFDNLIQQHSNGVIGDTQNVKTRCTEEDLLRLKDISLRAQRAGEIFRDRLDLQKTRRLDEVSEENY
jgi:hypothetical protein